MSNGINKVIIMGNLGQDPFNGNLPTGQLVTRISVATKRSWKDKDGKLQEHTEWHPICFFDRQAEIASRYLKKGSRVFVEGYLKTNKFKDKQDIERTKTEIVGTNIQLMDPKYTENDEQEAAAPVMTSVKKEEINYDDVPF